MIHASPKRSADKESCAIVLKLSSSTIRDQLVSKSHKLSHKSVNEIFDSEREGHLSLFPLWPKSTYEILKEARKKSKELNYAKPIARNLRVYMRENSKSKLVLFKSKQDLTTMKFRHTPPPVY